MAQITLIVVLMMTSASLVAAQGPTKHTITEVKGKPDFPGNGTFIGSWDYPTTYSIVSSRRYGNRAIIDVLYKWGPKTNYPGDERTTSFIYVYEDRTWKLDDVYTFRGEFATAESLNQYFLDKR